MRILLTGASGFIGRRTAASLKKRYPKADIFCTASLTDSALEKSGIALLKSLKITLVRLDLSRADQLKKLPKKMDYVIHLAASAETSDKDHSFNEISMHNLLNYLDPAVLKHFIFTSTTAVWAGRKNLHQPISEIDPPYPSNEYGRSKITAENLLKSWGRKHQVPFTVFRLSTVYGADTRPNGLFDALKKLIPQKSFITRLNWPGLTSLVYVGDVANILTIAMTSKTKQNLYIVYAESLTLEQISRLMHRAMGAPYRSINLPLIIWEFFKLLTGIFFIFEFLPGKIYNFFWRCTLIINNTLFCQSSRLKKDFPALKLSKFETHLNEVTR